MNIKLASTSLRINSTTVLLVLGTLLLLVCGLVEGAKSQNEDETPSLARPEAPPLPPSRKQPDYDYDQDAVVATGQRKLRKQTDTTPTNTTIKTTTATSLRELTVASYTDTDIGTVSIVGSSSLNSGKFTIRGSGTGITTSYSPPDSFFYLWKALNGTGRIKANLISQSSTATDAIAGIMIRNNTNHGSTFAAVWRNGEGKVTAARRVTRQSVTYIKDSPDPLSLPNVWMRVKREPRQNGLTGYIYLMGISSNNKDWNTLTEYDEGPGGTMMNENVHIGLFVSSGSNNLLGNAVFQNVTIVT